MFEQSILRKGNGKRRFAAACLGVTGEALVLAAVVVVPVMWPQVLPRPKEWLSIYTPAVPRPLGSVAKLKATHVEPGRNASAPHPFTMPVSMPAKAAILTDPPVEVAGFAVPGGIGAGSPDGVANGFSLPGFLLSNRPAPAYRPAEPHAVSAPPKDTAAPPVRIRISGGVQEGKLLVCVKPVYPPLAKAARVSGAVELEAVIGTDGRLKEVRVTSGNPLLAPAALQAVKQWVYRPTFLNGDPVEVSTTIVVNFTLGA
jgi:periplasmic protein TonB